MNLFNKSVLNRKMAAVYNNITSSIAFYPVIITLFYLLLVTCMLWFDYSEPARELNEEMPWLQFKEMSAVRAILSTLIAGIISLMALSFSMVMVVLNQATNAISPKVMQGLVTKKEHQFVLGNQFGAILYFMVVLLLLRGIDFYKIPTFSVTLGLLLGFWSLGLFVYFIHSISQSIQVTNIIAGIHHQTTLVLNKLKIDLAEVIPVQAPDFKNAIPVITDKSGFFQEVNTGALLEIAEKHDLEIMLAPHLTEYVPGGSPLFYAQGNEGKLSPEEKKEIYNTIIFFKGENIKTNYVYGFTQLGEIAVKSLSPGINDAGIAVICLQYLADLFVQLYTVNYPEVFADDSGKPRLLVRNIKFERLFTQTISPIRYYGRQDLTIARSLMQLFYAVAQTDRADQKYREMLNQHAEAVLAAIQDTYLIGEDAYYLNQVIEKMDQLSPPYFQIGKVKLRDQIYRK